MFTAIDRRANVDEMNAMELRISQAEAQNEVIQARNRVLEEKKLVWIEEQFEERKVPRSEDEPEPDLGAFLFLNVALSWGVILICKCFGTFFSFPSARD